MKTSRFLISMAACSLFGSAVLADPLGGFTREDARRVDPLPRYEMVPATVVKLGVRTNGWFVVTLDNGQVWSQTENRPTAQVHVGDNITVRKARIGSYTLTTKDNIETTVRRDR